MQALAEQVAAQGVEDRLVDVVKGFVECRSLPCAGGGDGGDGDGGGSAGEYLLEGIPV